MRLVYCMREALEGARARMLADGEEADATSSPYFFNGGVTGSQVASGDADILTFRGSVVAVDDEFPDAIFALRSTDGEEREFSLHRSAGKVSVGERAIVRYVQIPSSRPRPDGSVRWIIHVTEIWLS